MSMFNQRYDKDVPTWVADTWGIFCNQIKIV